MDVQGLAEGQAVLPELEPERERPGAVRARRACREVRLRLGRHPAQLGAQPGVHLQQLVDEAGERRVRVRVLQPHHR